jgi:uncharacterized protein
VAGTAPSALAGTAPSALAEAGVVEAGLVQAGRKGAVLRVHLQPSAASEGLVGLHGDSLKVRVRAPAVDGRANEALLRLLAHELAVPLASLAFSGGTTSRDKRVRFAAVGAGELVEHLVDALARARRSR